MASFELRTATAEDLDEWGAVAAAAFAYKGGDPRRFRWNYDADPTSTPSDIYLACKDGRIAAAIRALPKRIHVGERVYAARGIADVCTHPEMQRQGAAGQLLNIILAKLRGDSATENAPDVVEHKDAGGGDAHAGAVVSVLHAAEAMRGFYAKYGYVRIPVAMSVVQVPRPADDGGCGRLCTAMDGIFLRRCDYSCDADRDRVSAIHAAYSRGFTGVHERSASRWRSWVPYIIGSTTWIIERDDGAGGVEVVAYIAARHRRGVTTLAEYGAVESWQHHVNERTAFLAGLSVAAQSALAAAEDGASAMSAPVDVQCPAALCARVFGDDVYPAAASIVDDGWMYLDLQHSGTDSRSVVAQIAAHASTHVVWQTDFF